MRKSKATAHAPAHAMPATKRPRFTRGTALLHAARDRVRSVDTAEARRAVTELRRWPVPSDAAHLPATDDMLVPRSIWQRGAHLSLTPEFGVAAAAYVVCVWIVIGSAATPASDQLPVARDVDIIQFDTPPDAAEEGSAPYRPQRAQPEVRLAPVEQVDSTFFTGLQNVLNGLNSQPGQPRPYQPDLPGVLPATDPALAPVLDPLAPVPPDALAPPVLGPDGRILEAPHLGATVPPPPGVEPQPPVVTPPVVTPETPAPVTQTPASATQTPVTTPEAPAPVPQTPVVTTPEAPVAAPSSPTVVPSSSQAPTTAGQQPLGPPPGPAG